MKKRKLQLLERCVRLEVEHAEMKQQIATLTAFVTQQASLVAMPHVLTRALSVVDGENRVRAQLLVNEQGPCLTLYRADGHRVGVLGEMEASGYLTVGNASNECSVVGAGYVHVQTGPAEMETMSASGEATEG